MADAPANSMAGGGDTPAPVGDAPAGAGAPPADQGQTQGAPPAEGAKPEGDKPEADGNAEGAFDAKALALPEGFAVDEKSMAKFSEVAKEFGISQKAAQALVNLQAETLKESTSASQATFEKTQTDWQNSIRNDPEVGGAKLDGNLQTIAKAIEQFGTPGFKDALNLTGAGNNPDVFKTFLKMAQALTEGGAVNGAPPSKGVQAVDPLEAMAARMYPNSPKG